MSFIEKVVRNSPVTGLMDMGRNKIIPYNPVLRKYARELRKNSTVAEILLWREIKGRKLGVQFHRQVPINNFIVDFYCHEFMLAIEVDGSSHDTKSQQKKDALKEYQLSRYGITMFRIDDRDIKRNLDSVIRFIEFEIQKIVSP